MDRRDFLKLSLMSAGGIVGTSAFIPSESAQAKGVDLVSSKGILNVALVAEEKMIAYGNSTRWAMTYNGTSPGPVLRVRPGDTLNVTLTNKLKAPTNLHTHGLHASPSGNGDNPFLMIEPGQTYRYSIRISKYQKSGTFWYHPHHHEFSAAQVSSGLAGALIVEDTLDSLTIFRKSTERTFVLSDPRIGSSSAVSQTSQMDTMHGRSGPNTLLNSKLMPTFTAIGATPERWRVVNSCVSQYQTIWVEGAKIFQLSTDSSRLSRPFAMDNITMTPGQRTEFVVLAPKAGTYVFRNSNQKLAELVVKEATRSISAEKILPFEPIRTVNGVRKIKVVGQGMAMMSGNGHEAAFTFDGKSFDPNRIDQKVKFGVTEEWAISNPSSMHHPFHLHAWPFQIADDGQGNFLEGWHDTVNLPSGSTVKIRIPFINIAGKTVYHCHILDHEDGGMMGVIKVS